MPYPSEEASRLGHVPVAISKTVEDAFQRWEVAQARPEDDGTVSALCTPIDDLPGAGVSTGVRFAITVDGSETEVEATRRYPTIKVGYVRVAGSLLELEKLQRAGDGPFVDPRQVSQSHRASAFDVALPGSGLVRHGLTGRDTWRQEVDLFFRSARYDEESTLTLADSLLALHGAPGRPADALAVRVCPSCARAFAAGHEPQVGKSGGTCPACGGALFLADVLRSHDEYSPEGSNQTAITRVMNVAERLMTLSYLDLFFAHAQDPMDAFRQTIFITDGPLALFGGVAPLKRRFHEYLQALAAWSEPLGLQVPLVVGVEKSGRFVEHADLIKELVPRGQVMRLTNDYINRMTGRPEGNAYGTDEFYGRRFIYRTTSGDPLVITVPPRNGVLPYEGSGAEEFENYPLLRPVCEILDAVRTRLFPNAIIPVALAHNSAALPLGVGQSVLRALAQRGIGLPHDTQIRQRTNFAR